MADEEVHEIELKGKQLVFLFMAATVLAVVIFLCGVMVGRGVPTRAASEIDIPDQASFNATESAELSPVRAVSTDGIAPTTAQETLTYATLLEEPDPPAETLPPEPAAAVPEPAAVVPEPVVALQPAPEPVTPEPAPAPPPLARPRPAVAPVTATADTTLAEPPGAGFVVQVAAVRQRAEADTIASRLSTKGYPAFVTIAGSNFRVRVGKYTDRREAETVAGRLKAEERFEPWITR